jgi:hypothetical protein
MAEEFWSSLICSYQCPCLKQEHIRLSTSSLCTTRGYWLVYCAPESELHIIQNPFQQQIMKRGPLPNQMRPWNWIMHLAQNESATCMASYFYDLLFFNFNVKEMVILLKSLHLTFLWLALDTVLRTGLVALLNLLRKDLGHNKPEIFPP